MASAATIQPAAEPTAGGAEPAVAGLLSADALQQQEHAVLQPIAAVPGAWTAAGLLTPKECERMITAARAKGIEHNHTSSLHGASDQLRDCLRVEVDDPGLADTV